MRGHEHDVEEAARPKGDRIPHEDTDLLGRAAAAGRPDVLGPAGLLGLQRVAGNAAVGDMVGDVAESPVHGVVNSGGGTGLDPDTRGDMESRFGQDFGDVRVHTDSAAHDSAAAVNARAYTVGSNIVFQRGMYDPGSDQGRHTLAHELTHVVQQRSGPVDGTDAGGGVRVSDPSDRFEREAVATADRVMSGPSPVAGVGSVPGPGGGGAVQRVAAGDVQRHAEDDAEVQRIEDGAPIVQREEEAAPEEEEAPA
ncbi:eCIS core domain-containing protein [Longispora urticae]